MTGIHRAWESRGLYYDACEVRYVAEQRTRVNWEMNDRIEYLYINDYRHRDLDREMIAEGAVKLSPEDILDRILVQRYT